MTGAASARGVSFGVFLIIATALTISVQDLVFKLFSSDLTLWQIFTLRGVIAIGALLVIGAVRGQLWPVVQHALHDWSILRAFCLTMTFLAFYAAIPFLSLSTVGAANYIAPIFVAVLSAFVIGERVGLLGWLSAILGFLGVVTLLQPGTDAFSVFALLPIVGAAFYAIGHIITRTRCRAVPVAALALSLNVVMCIAGALISATLFLVPASPELVANYPYLFGEWTGVGVTDWLVLALLAGFTVSIGLMLAAAYQAAPPAVIATFEYSYLVFVALWDVIFFGTPPTPLSLAGMAMIVVAGLLVMRRPA